MMQIDELVRFKKKEEESSNAKKKKKEKCKDWVWVTPGEFPAALYADWPAVSGRLTDMHSVGQLQSLRNVTCQSPAYFSPHGMISIITHVITWLQMHTHQNRDQSVNTVCVDEEQLGKKI